MPRILLGTAKTDLTLEELVDIEYAKINKLATSSTTGADDNASKRYLAYLADPDCNPVIKQRIAEVLAWTDSLWGAYVPVAARIRAGDRTATIDMSIIPPCPWLWYEIIGYTDP